MHIKRHNTNYSWPISRKGTKYLVVPSHNKKSGIPLLVISRDVLKLVKTRKELKKVLLDGKIKVNGKIIKEDNLSLSIFDIITIIPENISYKINVSNDKRINAEVINDKDSGSKIYKVINKKILKGRKIQLNLNDGRNILSNEKINVGYSVIINLFPVHIVGCIESPLKFSILELFI